MKTKKEIYEDVRTTKTEGGWLHEYWVKDTLWYCHINRFDPTPRVYACNDVYNAVEIGSTKEDFIDFLYDIEKQTGYTVLIKRATYWFNRFIRLRDTDEYGYGTCITCGKGIRFGTKECHAGHFYSAGHHPVLKFNEDNVHLQCLQCNYFKASAGAVYAANLRKKIGTQKMAWLEVKAGMGKRTVIKRDRYFYEDIISRYKSKCKELEKQKMV